MIITIHIMIISNISIDIATVIGIISAGCTYISAETVLKDEQLLQQMADIHL